jgi:hypothetical protein
MREIGKHASYSSQKGIESDDVDSFVLSSTSQPSSRCARPTNWKPTMSMIPSRGQVEVTGEVGT